MASVLNKPGLLIERLPRLGLSDLVRLAIELGATTTGGPLSPSERGVVRETLAMPKPSSEVVARVRASVAAGYDPLGDAFMEALSPEERRPLGAVYTPPALVGPMVDWVSDQHPDRVVDAGCGSGRYTLAVAQANPHIDVIAVDLDPVATLICRANAAVTGASRVRVLQADYMQLDLPEIAGRTAFIGNPPYVRHHNISPEAKARTQAIAEQLGLHMSALAGLHVHFYLATARYARPGDVVCFVTSAEWLDVGYGEVLRSLLSHHLGARTLHLIDPQATPFVDAMTTALITTCEVGHTSQHLRFRTVPSGEALGSLAAGGHLVARREAASCGRWSQLFSHSTRAVRRSNESDANDLVPLGSLVRVSRGVATGANSYFVMSADEAQRRGLRQFARPVVSSAAEIIVSPGIIHSTPERNVIIDLPSDLDLQAPAALAIREYLSEGESRQIPKRYLCAHRRPWWRLGIGQAPRVIATYMARQAPVFALNPDELVILNIAHGFYPRVPMTDGELLALVRYLNNARESYRGEGRTYHGGLEKFEPREMESLLVPSLPRLRELAEEL